MGLTALTIDFLSIFYFPFLSPPLIVLHKEDPLPSSQEP